MSETMSFQEWNSRLPQALRDARVWPKGRAFESFVKGETFQHHWGRTLTETDNLIFSAAGLHYNPVYFNADYCREQGHERTPVNPLLLFLTVFGLTVEDCSELGGYFLGVDELTYHGRAYVGDTVEARSTVLSARRSLSRPGFGIVTWHTRGFIGERLAVDFRRTNLVKTLP